MNVDVIPRLDRLTDNLEAQSRDMSTLDQEIQRLQDSLSHNMQGVDNLNELLMQEKQERRSSEELLTEFLRDTRETTSQEIRTHGIAMEDMRKSLSSLLEQERNERNVAVTSVRNVVIALQKELQPLTDDFPSIRTRLGEAESFLQGRVKELMKTLEQSMHDRQASHNETERRLAELAAGIQKEANTRSALAEEIDQVLKTFRTKMKHTVTEQADLARQSREELRRQCMDQIDKERHLREAHQSALQEQLSDWRSFLDTRVESFETSLLQTSQRLEAQLASELRDVEASSLRISEEFSRQLREQKETLATKLAEEQHTRLSQTENIEEHIDFLDGFFQDARDLFLKRGQRPRQLLTRRSSSGSGTPRAPLSARGHTPEPFAGRT